MQLNVFRLAAAAVQQRTLSGAVVSVLGMGLAFLLFISEFTLYRGTETHSSLVVDRPVHGGAPAFLAILMDLEFPALACGAVEVDAYDARGELFTDAVRELDMRALATGAGCRVVGTVRVPRVAGKLQNAWRVGGAAQKSGLAKEAFNATHTIHSLRFGSPMTVGISSISASNPLDGVAHSSYYDSAAAFKADAEGPVQRRGRGNADHLGKAGRTMKFQYFAKVVPSKHVALSGHTQRSNQFSVTENHVAVGAAHLQNMGWEWELKHAGADFPGLFVEYQISPMLLVYTEERMSALHFVTSACAIVGGVFAVSKMVDRVIHAGGKAIFGAKAD